MARTRKTARLRNGCLASIASVAVLVAAIAAVMVWQARRAPAGRPVYVALGSSYAAGAGLGALQAGSPWACARSVGGYPPRLARQLRMPMVDMSCGGAVTRHVLHGGQFFQGPQIRAITRETRLVTLTVGGNDIGYVGDLSMLAARRTDTLFGRFVRQFWSGPKATPERDLPGLEGRLDAILVAIRRKAPKARVVVVTYPTIVPDAATCPVVGLSLSEAARMREVGDQLAAVTIAAARRAGATVVDMNSLGRKHDACSSDPWISGWSNGGMAAFHPTVRGAQATARAIASALARSPQ